MCENEYAIYEGERHRWTCPQCDLMNEEEGDPRGDQVECDECEWTGQVESG